MIGYLALAIGLAGALISAATGGGAAYGSESAGKPVWLAVVASSREPTAIAQALVRIAARAPHALVANTADCAEARPLFAVVTEISSTPAEAQTALARAREISPDAFLKRCPVLRGSLLDLGIGAVDASIAKVSAQAVNWADADRVSSATSLGEPGSFVAQRHYVVAPDDMLEGRRERALLARPDGTRVVLEENCFVQGKPVAADGTIAFACAREQAGHTILHETIAVKADGTKLASFPHCRSPEWAAPGRLRCQGEAVTTEGQLVLTPREMTIPGSG